MPVLDLGIANTQYPDLVDKFTGHKLLVIGGARCVWDDLASIGVRPDAHNSGFHVMCVNDIVMHYPGKITHFYTNDHRWLGKWIDARRDLIVRKFGPIKYLHSCVTGAKYNWPWPGHGTSSLGAVYCGLAMGYEQIVLCGIPLDDSGHYFDPPWVKTNFMREVGTQPDGQMMYWQQAKRVNFKGKVFGTSGRTAELLGRP
jgi:hypothetical protein